MKFLRVLLFAIVCAVRMERFMVLALSWKNVVDKLSGITESCVNLEEESNETIERMQILLRKNTQLEMRTKKIVSEVDAVGKKVKDAPTTEHLNVQAQQLEEQIVDFKQMLEKLALYVRTLAHKVEHERVNRLYRLKADVIDLEVEAMERKEPGSCVLQELMGSEANRKIIPDDRIIIRNGSGVAGDLRFEGKGLESTLASKTEILIVLSNDTKKPVYIKSIDLSGSVNVAQTTVNLVVNPGYNVGITSPDGHLLIGQKANALRIQVTEVNRRGGLDEDPLDGSYTLKISIEGCPVSSSTGSIMK